jgi:hypothetical protein
MGRSALACLRSLKWQAKALRPDKPILYGQIIMIGYEYFYELPY